MRKLLAAAAALAPLMAASGVQAEVVISNGRTTPIQTSNATGTAADSIRLANNGSIAITTGTAVTINSSHSVDLDSGSKITMANAANGATGILAEGGNTANITIGGVISITDDIDADDDRDTDDDGDLDGDFANGTGRYGLRVTGAAPLVGNILIERTGSINVEGNESYGVSIEAPLTGNVTSLGAVSVVGNDSYAVRNTGTVSGDILLTGGGISATGENSVAVAVDAAVGGTLQIQTSVTATGYRYTTPPGVRPTDPANVVATRLYLDELDADDLLQGGPAVRVTADVGGGVLLDTGPTYGVLGIEGDDDGDGVKNGDEDLDGDGTKNREDTDRDGDGILDTNEGAASLISVGGAPALQIGSTTSDVTLGLVGTGGNAYGLVNRGSITANGLYAGVDAESVRIGVDGGQTTTVAGGFNNEGSITASALTANSTAVVFGDGATTPLFRNTGTIGAQATTEGEHEAIAVLIEADANLPEMVNTGDITAVVNGEKGDATAIRDLSGTLTELTNNGGIYGAIIRNDDANDADDDNTDPTDEEVTGTIVAIDLQANTTGVMFIQDGLAQGNRYDTDSDGKTDDVDTDDDGDGILDADDDQDSDNDNDGVFNADEPAVGGAILLGSGSDTVDIRNGVIAGDIAFGAGQDTMLVSGGAIYRGALSDTDGQLSIGVTDGVLDARQAEAVDVSDLTVGGDGALVVTVDPEANLSGGFNVAGTATLADGAGLSVRFSSLIDDPERFTIIEAGQLNYGAVELDNDLASSPYLFVVTAGADVAAGEVYIDARRRTSDEAGMIKVEAQAFDAFYESLGSDDALLNAFLSQTDRDGFINLYEQILPDHSGGPLLSLASGIDAVTRALTGRNAIATPGTTSAWVQEINFYAEKDRTDSYGFESEGFGVAGGVERGTNLGAFGLSVAFTSSDIEDPEAEAEEVLSANLIELGLYWRAQGQNWTTWARAAGGYATFDSTRALVGEGININNESSWNGFTLSFAAGASYERNFGRMNVRPEVYAEYFSLSEDGHSESGGGDGFDLDIDDRDGHIFSTVAAVNIGYGFGTNGWIRPELRLGYRQNISVDVGDTTARFVSGGPDFILTPGSIEGGGFIAGLRLGVGNELGMLSISADAEQIEDYVRYTLLLRASFKF